MVVFCRKCGNVCMDGRVYCPNCQPAEGVGEKNALKPFHKITQAEYVGFLNLRYGDGAAQVAKDTYHEFEVREASGKSPREIFLEMCKGKKIKTVDDVIRFKQRVVPKEEPIYAPVDLPDDLGCVADEYMV